MPSGVGRVVGGHVHSLHGGDRPTLGRGDSFLQLTEFVGQRRLVTHGGRHTSQKCGHFRTGLREAEDVVDEQQGVSPGGVTEPFGHCQRGQRDAETGSGWLVHLAEHHAGLLDDVTTGRADFGFLHFQPQVVPFAGSFTDPANTEYPP